MEKVKYSFSYFTLLFLTILYLPFINCGTYNASESVRWCTIVGSTPTTGKTPGASANAKAYASILPGVFAKALAVEPFVSRFGKSGLAHRVARCVKSTATFSYPTKRKLSRNCRVNLFRFGVQNHKSTYQFCDNGLTIYHIMSQMYVESRGDYRVISHRNCHGAMQVNPVTGKEYGYPEWSLTHPVIGTEAGIAVMSKLWGRFHFVTNSNERWKLALASYNAGYGRTIRSFRTHGKNWQRGIPGETRLYIRKVMNRYYGRNNELSR